MPTIGNESLPGLSPDSDGVFGGYTTGAADFRFLVTYSPSHVQNKIQLSLSELKTKLIGGHSNGGENISTATRV